MMILGTHGDCLGYLLTLRFAKQCRCVDDEFVRCNVLLLALLLCESHTHNVHVRCYCSSKYSRRTVGLSVQDTLHVTCTLQHLRSDQHRAFAETDSNYAAVDKLVNSSANMQRFLDDIIKYHSVHQQEGLAQNNQ